MKISVIIPCYNQAKYLSDAITSLLNQSYSAWEAIVIDDGSSDDVPAALSVFDDARIIYFRQENKGPSAARNKGISLSTGTYIQFLDADDMLHKYKFEAQIRGLKLHNADVSISGYETFYQGKPISTDTELRGVNPFTDIATRWEKGLCIPISCFFFRKYVIKGVNGFKESLRDHEDWDFHLRVAICNYHYIHDPSKFALYRIHSKSICRSTDMSEGKAKVTSFYAVCPQVPLHLQDFFREETLAIYPDYEFPDPVDINTMASYDQYPLLTVTFVICVRIDSEDRLRNLDFCMKFLTKNFKTQILLVESDSESRIQNRYSGAIHLFYKSISPTFHRTKMINDAVKEHVFTPYFCNLDLDVVLPPAAYIDSVALLKKYSVVYPYNGKFYDIPAEYARNLNLSIYDIDIGSAGLVNSNSNGGAVFFRREDFIEGGLENERFISWGWEDNEIYVRFSKLGYKIKRLENPIFHFTHERGINSSETNPYFNQNAEEFKRVDAMSETDLRKYIETTFTWKTFTKL